jgi:L-amino acid N-acyltransferase YncA
MWRDCNLVFEYVKPYVYAGTTAVMEMLSLTRNHWPQVREIYLAGIRSGDATFETSVPSWEEWDQAHLKFARLIALTRGEVRGWAALSRISQRRAYAGVAEVSVYVGTGSRGQGYGTALLETLIAEAEKNAIWTLQASIFPENLASTALHKAAGFREVGQRDRIAQLNGVWRNTLLMERRSALVGTD